jgi:hypothetical protein
VSEELAISWSEYWAAFKSGTPEDLAKMPKIYDRIERMMRVANSRKSTLKMLAQLL